MKVSPSPSPSLFRTGAVKIFSSLFLRREGRREGAPLSPSLPLRNGGSQNFIIPVFEEGGKERGEPPLSLPPSSESGQKKFDLPCF